MSRPSEAAGPGAAGAPIVTIGTPLTVWDSSSDPSARTGTIIRWNGRAEEGSRHSLLRYVETHEERLRDRYLSWIHELGETRIDGRRLVDHLAFDDGLSYWWLTRLAEKSPYKSPITDAIRLLALEEMIVRDRPQALRLVSGNPILDETVGALCRNLGIAYEWERVPERPDGTRGLRRVYRQFPHLLQGLGTLVNHLCSRWPLRNADTSGPAPSDRSLLVCSYFVGTQATAAGNGRFASRFWEGIPDLIAKLRLSGTWLQHYSPHDAVPTPRIALEWVRRFNRDQRKQGFHTFVDSYLSLRVVGRVLGRWFTLVRWSWRLRAIEHAFRPAGSHLSLWPLMRTEWQTSMRGAAAVDNLLLIELFDAALCHRPRQATGLYLCENLPWERAMIHAWRKYGHGRLIGAAVHVSVRFWDLRYFNDRRTMRSTQAHALPRPDVVALNGKAAVDTCLGAGYSPDDIVECEALRFGTLTEEAVVATSAPRQGPIKVLILGDYMPGSTLDLMRLLEASAAHLAGRVSYTIKAHPSWPVAATDYPTLALDIVTDPLPGIVRNFDVAISSNMTSAVLDAYFAGVPVVVKLDDAELNMSPLRGQPGVRFVCTVAELVEALQAPNRTAAVNRPQSEFFFIDSALPRWERLLSSAIGT